MGVLQSKEPIKILKTNMRFTRQRVDGNIEYEIDN